MQNNKVETPGATEKVDVEAAYVQKLLNKKVLTDGEAQYLMRESAKFLREYMDSSVTG